MKKYFLFVLVIGLSNFGFADQEAPNSLYVTANGDRYAKSLPSDLYGTKGTTRVYLVREKDDLLEFTYDWYSPGQLFLRGGAWGLSVVRFGPSLRGSKASKDDLLIAFYNNDKLVASYSALDIAETPDAVETSVSHYSVIKKILGYRVTNFKQQNSSNDCVFEIETVRGKKISFDVVTGQMTSRMFGPLRQLP